MSDEREPPAPELNIDDKFAERLTHLTRIAALERELAAAQARIAELERAAGVLRSCLSRAIEMSDEAWSDLTFRESAMLKPTIDQWRKAVGVE